MQSSPHDDTMKVFLKKRFFAFSGPATITCCWKVTWCPIFLKKNAVQKWKREATK